MKYLKLAIIFLTAGLMFAGELTEEEKAFFRANVVIPVPSEIIMALDVLSETNWRAVVNYDYSANYAENYKIALNLGVRVAQGFIAIQAQDRRNTGEMFLLSRDLAENFGARSEMFVDRDQITKLLNEGKWLDLREILDDIHLKVKEEMKKYHNDFVVLAGIGGWLEGLHIVTKALTANYSEEASTILYQPDLVEHFIQETVRLQKSNSDNPEVKAIIENLPVIRDLCEVGYGNPIPKENIEKLYTIGKELNRIIVSGSGTKGGLAEEGTGKWVIIYSIIAAVIIAVYLSRRKKGGN